MTTTVSGDGGVRLKDFSSPAVIAERLERHSIPEPNSGCLLWFGPVDGRGYPKVTIGGKTLRATRVSFENSNGPLPPGKMACHKCDVPCCIEPTHLFAGTHKENMDDMRAKGRTNGRKTSLSAQTVAAILADPRSHVAVAAHFGISSSYVGNIKSGCRKPITALVAPRPNFTMETLAS